jgi:hypothetical protein
MCIGSGASPIGWASWRAAIFPRSLTTPQLWPERGQASLAAKWSLYEGAAGAAALELGANYSSEADPTCAGWWAASGADRQGLRRGVVSVEAAYLAQRPHCIHGKLDLAAGWRPDEKWLTMGQVFLDRRYGEGHVAKAQLSVVRPFSARTGFQFGSEAELTRAARATLRCYWAYGVEPSDTLPANCINPAI